MRSQRTPAGPSSGIDIAEAEAEANEDEADGLEPGEVADTAGKTTPARKPRKSGKEIEMAVDGGTDDSVAIKPTEMTETETTEEALARLISPYPFYCWQFHSKGLPAHRKKPGNPRFSASRTDGGNRRPL